VSKQGTQSLSFNVCFSCQNSAICASISAHGLAVLDEVLDEAIAQIVQTRPCAEGLRIADARTGSGAAPDPLAASRWSAPPSSRLVPAYGTAFCEGWAHCHEADRPVTGSGSAHTVPKSSYIPEPVLPEAAWE